MFLRYRIWPSARSHLVPGFILFLLVAPRCAGAAPTEWCPVSEALGPVRVAIERVLDRSRAILALPTDRLVTRIEGDDGVAAWRPAPGSDELGEATEFLVDELARVTSGEGAAGNLTLGDSRSFAMRAVLVRNLAWGISGFSRTAPARPDPSRRIVAAATLRTRLNELTAKTAALSEELRRAERVLAGIGGAVPRPLRPLLPLMVLVLDGPAARRGMLLEDGGSGGSTLGLRPELRARLLDLATAARWASKSRRAGGTPGRRPGAGDALAVLAGELVELGRSRFPKATGEPGLDESLRRVWGAIAGVVDQRPRGAGGRGRPGA